MSRSLVFCLSFNVLFRSEARLESGTKETVSTYGKTILEDDATADFTIRCPTKEFRVHKAILCARSPVFRASILTPMKEASKGEIFLEEIDEKTMATTINFLYTGELELGEDPDIPALAWAGTKYLLPGFMDRLGIQAGKLDLKGEIIADLLLTANLHGAEELKRIALNKIRGNRKIFSDEGFRKVMEKADPSIIMDVFKDL